jgi:hypothetical protein
MRGKLTLRICGARCLRVGHDLFVRKAFTQDEIQIQSGLSA